jgi:hypothetical protein
LKHFVLQSAWLQQQRIPKRAQAASQQIEFGLPVQSVSFRQHLFAVTQLGFPLLPPIGAARSRRSKRLAKDVASQEISLRYLIATLA